MKNRLKVKILCLGFAAIIFGFGSCWNSCFQTLAVKNAKNTKNTFQTKPKCGNKYKRIRKKLLYRHPENLNNKNKLNNEKKKQIE